MVAVLLAFAPVGLVRVSAAAAETCLGSTATHVMTEGEGTFTGTDDIDVVVGTEGDDIVFGLGGNDRLCGLGGDDELWSGDGINYLAPGDGDDVVHGNTLLGADVVSYEEWTGPVTVDLGVDAAHDNIDELVDIHTVTGSAYDDTMVGSGSADRLTGGPGDDVLRGGGGDDHLFGREGADTFEGGAGDDFLQGAGEQQCQVGGPCSPIDWSDDDRVTYEHSPGPVDVSLGATATGDGADKVYNIEHVLGSPYDDSILGQSETNRLEGGEGDDVILGDDGDDTLLGGPGDDRLHGQAGQDTISFIGATDGVVVDLLAHTATGQGTDYLYEAQAVVGGRYADILRGTVFSEQLVGGDGPDRLVGRGGADVLAGGRGNDLVAGGADDDTFRGGTGLDRVTFAGASQPIVADLANGVASGQGEDDLESIENLTGSPFSDFLLGDARPNRLFGSDGRDRLVGREGQDTCAGGTGHDSAASCEVLASIP